MVVQLYQPLIGTSEKKAVMRVLESKILTRGEELKKFENEFAKLIGKKYAVAVNSGSSALSLAVKAIGWDKGDEILTTPFSYIASANSLTLENQKPIFVDIDPKTLNMSAKSAEKLITKKTKGILLVHIYGLPVDISGFEKIAQKYHLSVIEDCCQAIFPSSKKYLVGKLGDVCVYSFSFNKIVTTAGEGGIIATNNFKFASFCRSLRDQGRNNRRNWLCHVVPGFNYRLTEIQAAFGRAQLKQICIFINKREKIAKWYSLNLKEVKGISLPYNSKSLRSWIFYYIQLNNSFVRNRLANELKKAQITTHCPQAIPNFPEYKKNGYQINQYPKTKQAVSTILELPLYPDLKYWEVKYICSKIKEIVNQIR